MAEVQKQDKSVSLQSSLIQAQHQSNQSMASSSEVIWASVFWGMAWICLPSPAKSYVNPFWWVFCSALGGRTNAFLMSQKTWGGDGENLNV